MVSAIIVAGGQGLRMGADAPKQFLNIAFRPILMRTIEVLHNHPDVSEVIVVLPISHVGYWQQLCKSFSFEITHKIANGGESRYHSVRSGLSRVSPDSRYVMVHDAVRPFVTAVLLNRLIESVQSKQCVVPVIEMVDSIRRITSEGKSVHVDRSIIKRVQTPQIFDKEILIAAYDSGYKEGFTDDASVVESIGYDIFTVDGDANNIKITNKLDIVVAESLLAGQ